MGCYLLIILSEPICKEHKEKILQRVAKGLLSWDSEKTECDLMEVEDVLQSKLSKNNIEISEILLQYSNDKLAIEVLFNPQIYTLKQCLKNLLLSPTAYKHIIHAGYSFSGTGSWMCDDGVFEFQHFIDTFRDKDVENFLQSFPYGFITVHMHCAPVGQWVINDLKAQSFSKYVKVELNPSDSSHGVKGAASLLDFFDASLMQLNLEAKMSPTSVVGNIRFERPTLYIFPSGQGNCSLFGITGFTMLIDGGFTPVPSFWNFIRHLERLDAIMVTRLNEDNLWGVSSLFKKKALHPVYPQIGYIFCNIAEGHANGLTEKKQQHNNAENKELVISVIEVGQELLENLKHVGLNPLHCLREPLDTIEPMVLYHKVGHGTLEMYILSPPRDSRILNEFLEHWNASKESFSVVRTSSASVNGSDIAIPISNIMSICCLLIWRPYDKNDKIARMLFPGSAPQSRIFEGLERVKKLSILQHQTCTQQTIIDSDNVKTTDQISRFNQKSRFRSASPIFRNKKPKQFTPHDKQASVDIEKGGESSDASISPKQKQKILPQRPPKQPQQQLQQQNVTKNVQPKPKTTDKQETQIAKKDEKVLSAKKVIAKDVKKEVINNDKRKPKPKAKSRAAKESGVKSKVIAPSASPTKTDDNTDDEVLKITLTMNGYDDSSKQEKPDDTQKEAQNFEPDSLNLGLLKDDVEPDSLDSHSHDATTEMCKDSLDVSEDEAYTATTKESADETVIDSEQTGSVMPEVIDDASTTSDFVSDAKVEDNLSGTVEDRSYESMVEQSADEHEESSCADKSDETTTLAETPDNVIDDHREDGTALVEGVEHLKEDEKINDEVIEIVKQSVRIDNNEDSKTDENIDDEDKIISKTDTDIPDDNLVNVTAETHDITIDDHKDDQKVVVESVEHLKEDQIKVEKLNDKVIEIEIIEISKTDENIDEKHSIISKTDTELSDDNLVNQTEVCTSDTSKDHQLELTDQITAVKDVELISETEKHLEKPAVKDQISDDLIQSKIIDSEADHQDYIRRMSDEHSSQNVDELSDKILAKEITAKSSDDKFEAEITKIKISDMTEDNKVPLVDTEIIDANGSISYEQPTDDSLDKSDDKIVVEEEDILEAKEETIKQDMKNISDTKIGYEVERQHNLIKDNKFDGTEHTIESSSVTDEQESKTIDSKLRKVSTELDDSEAKRESQSFTSESETKIVAQSSDKHLHVTDEVQTGESKSNLELSDDLLEKTAKPTEISTKDTITSSSRTDEQPIETIDSKQHKVDTELDNSDVKRGEQSLISKIDTKIPDQSSRKLSEVTEVIERESISDTELYDDQQSDKTAKPSESDTTACDNEFKESSVIDEKRVEPSDAKQVEDLSQKSLSTSSDKLQETKQISGDLITKSVIEDSISLPLSSYESSSASSIVSIKNIGEDVDTKKLETKSDDADRDLSTKGFQSTVSVSQGTDKNSLGDEKRVEPSDSKQVVDLSQISLNTNDKPYEAKQISGDFMTTSVVEDSISLPMSSASIKNINEDVDTKKLDTKSDDADRDLSTKSFQSTVSANQEFTKNVLEDEKSQELSEPKVEYNIKSDNKYIPSEDLSDKPVKKDSSYVFSSDLSQSDDSNKLASVDSSIQNKNTKEDNNSYSTVEESAKQRKQSIGEQRDNGSDIFEREPVSQTITIREETDLNIDEKHSIISKTDTELSEDKLVNQTTEVCASDTSKDDHQLKLDDETKAAKNVELKVLPKEITEKSSDEKFEVEAEITKTKISDITEDNKVPAFDTKNIDDNRSISYGQPTDDSLNKTGDKVVADKEDISEAKEETVKQEMKNIRDTKIGEEVEHSLIEDNKYDGSEHTIKSSLMIDEPKTIDGKQRKLSTEFDDSEGKRVKSFTSELDTKIADQNSDKHLQILTEVQTGDSKSNVDLSEEILHKTGTPTETTEDSITSSNRPEEHPIETIDSKQLKVDTELDNSDVKRGEQSFISEIDTKIADESSVKRSEVTDKAQTGESKSNLELLDKTVITTQLSAEDITTTSSRLDEQPIKTIETIDRIQRKVDTELEDSYVKRDDQLLISGKQSEVTEVIERESISDIELRKQSIDYSSKYQESQNKISDKFERKSSETKSISEDDTRNKIKSQETTESLLISGENSKDTKLEKSESLSIGEIKSDEKEMLRKTSFSEKNDDKLIAADTDKAVDRFEEKTQSDTEIKEIKMSEQNILSESDNYLKRDNTAAIDSKEKREKFDEKTGESGDKIKEKVITTGEIKSETLGFHEQSSNETAKQTELITWSERQTSRYERDLTTDNNALEKSDGTSHVVSELTETKLDTDYSDNDGEKSKISDNKSVARESVFEAKNDDYGDNRDLDSKALAGNQFKHQEIEFTEKSDSREKNMRTDEEKSLMKKSIERSDDQQMKLDNASNLSEKDSNIKEINNESQHYYTDYSQKQSEDSNNTIKNRESVNTLQSTQQNQNHFGIKSVDLSDTTTTTTTTGLDVRFTTNTASESKRDDNNSEIEALVTDHVSPRKTTHETEILSKSSDDFTVSQTPDAQLTRQDFETTQSAPSLQSQYLYQINESVGDEKLSNKQQQPYKTKPLFEEMETNAEFGDSVSLPLSSYESSSASSILSFKNIGDDKDIKRIDIKSSVASDSDLNVKSRHSIVSEKQEISKNVLDDEKLFDRSDRKVEDLPQTSLSTSSDKPYEAKQISGDLRRKSVVDDSIGLPLSSYESSSASSLVSIKNISEDVDTKKLETKSDDADRDLSTKSFQSTVSANQEITKISLGDEKRVEPSDAKQVEDLSQISLNTNNKLYEAKQISGDLMTTSVVQDSISLPMSSASIKNISEDVDTKKLDTKSDVADRDLSTKSFQTTMSVNQEFTKSILGDEKRIEQSDTIQVVESSKTSLSTSDKPYEEKQTSVVEDSISLPLSSYESSSASSIVSIKNISEDVDTKQKVDTKSIDEDIDYYNAKSFQPTVTVSQETDKKVLEDEKSQESSKSKVEYNVKSDNKYIPRDLSDKSIKMDSSYVFSSDFSQSDDNDNEYFDSLNGDKQYVSQQSNTLASGDSSIQSKNAKEDNNSYSTVEESAKQSKQSIGEQRDYRSDIFEREPVSQTIIIREETDATPKQVTDLDAIVCEEEVFSGYGESSSSQTNKLTAPTLSTATKSIDDDEFDNLVEMYETQQIDRQYSVNQPKSELYRLSSSDQQAFDQPSSSSSSFGGYASGGYAKQSPQDLTEYSIESTSLNVAYPEMITVSGDTTPRSTPSSRSQSLCQSKESIDDESKEKLAKTSADVVSGKPIGATKQFPSAEMASSLEYPIDLPMSSYVSSSGSAAKTSTTVGSSKKIIDDSEMKIIEAQSDIETDFDVKSWGKPLKLPTLPVDSTIKQTKPSNRPKRATAAPNTTIYVDLAYVPHHADQHYCNHQYFQTIRARYYVFSGIDPHRQVFDALIEGKKQWAQKFQTTVIPTHDSETLSYWIATNQELLRENNIDVAPAANRCTVNLQNHDTKCSAYRVEF